MQLLVATVNSEFHGDDVFCAGTVTDAPALSGYENGELVEFWASDATQAEGTGLLLVDEDKLVEDPDGTDVYEERGN
jgi:hypothetical protein